MNYNKLKLLVVLALLPYFSKAENVEHLETQVEESPKIFNESPLIVEPQSINGPQQDFENVSDHSNFSNPKQSGKNLVSKKNLPIKRAELKDDKVYLDFRDAEIREVARVISKLAGVNILVSEEVRAKVTVNLEGLSWKEALDIILKLYNLSWMEKNGFIIIASNRRLQEEQEQAPLTTRIIPLNFISVDDVANYIKTMMSKRGQVSADKKTNSLIITDVPSAIENVKKVLSELDKKTPQVLIEVWVVDRTLSDDLDFGIDWSLVDTGSPEWANNPRAIQAKVANSAATNLVVTYAKTIVERGRLQGILNALQNKGKARILANPRVLTLDNMAATIDILQEIPYYEFSKSPGDVAGITTTKFKQGGIRLNVKPHITPDGHVLIDIITEQSFQSGSVTDDVGTQPIISVRKTANTMLVKDNETVIIGGLRAREKTATIKKVPILGDLPLLGALFRGTYTSDDVRELIIFLTPTIVKDQSQLVESEVKILNNAKTLLSEKSEKLEEESIEVQKKLFDLKKSQTKPQLPEEPKQISSDKKELQLSSEVIAKEKLQKQEISPIKEDVDSKIPNFRKLKLLPLKSPYENH